MQALQHWPYERVYFAPGRRMLVQALGLCSCAQSGFTGSPLTAVFPTLCFHVNIDLLLPPCRLWGCAAVPRGVPCFKL